MSYDTYFNGTLAITPTDLPCGLEELLIAAADEVGATREHSITVTVMDDQMGVAIGVRGEAKYEENVREHMDAILGALPDGYKVNGEIYGEGSEADDYWRYVIKDNEITYQTGTVTVTYE